jgi:RND family efflux transporter MFP subunit
MKSYFRPGTSVVLTFVTILFLSACSKEPMQPDDTLALESKPAKLVVIGQNSNNTFLNYPATVKAENVSALSFEVSGVVDILSVVESQKVQKGDVLAKLDVRDLQASLQSVQAQFDSANSEFERAGRLIKQDAISKSVFEQRRSQRDVNQAQLDTAHKALEDAILVAPFAGFIAEVSIKEKQAIQAGTTAITILGDGDMEATINLPASIIAVANRTGKSVGKAYLVFSFAPDIQVATALKELNLSADSASQTYKVTFTFTAPNEMNILPGMNATLWFPDPRNSEAEEQLAIPIASVAIDGNQKFVWLVDQSNSTVSRRDITVQDGVGEMLVVTSGLQMGDTVVAAGLSSISAGMKVHPWSKSSK